MWDKDNLQWSMIKEMEVTGMQAEVRIIEANDT